ncbi:hypothetical protein NKH18_32225 [Streptomyces sp. M10(2022)]
MDLQENMGLTSVDYVRNGLSSKPAWEDEDGVHVSVSWKTALLPVVRAVSEDPSAYAVIREAMTHQTAEGLAAMKPDSTGNMLSAPAARSAWALGNLDGVAADVVSYLGKDRGQEWQTAVLDGLSGTEKSEKVTVPAFPRMRRVPRCPVARGRGCQGAEALETQGTSMFGEWCDAVGSPGPAGRRRPTGSNAGRGWPAVRL